MRSILLFTLLIFSVNTITAQNQFEKGYYTDNQGVKTEGFLKTINFNDVNSESFKGLEFKKELNQETILLPILNISAFGIGNEMKYQKCKVQMDDVNLNKNFDWQKDLDLKPANLFLNVIVEGKATLYSFSSEKGDKYFYKVDGINNNVTQLIYKKYLIQGEKEKENTTFREQLFKEVVCEGETFRDFLNIKYDKKQLETIFENFNKCHDSAYLVYTEKFVKKGKLNFTAFGGVDFLKFSSKDNLIQDSQTDITYNLGVEGELLFPSEKWAIFLKLCYSNLDTEYNKGFDKLGPYLYEINYKIDSKFADIILGTRYYYRLNNVGKLFINAGLGISIPAGNVNSVLITRSEEDTYATEPLTINLIIDSGYFNLGFGYVYKNKFGVDLNFDFNKNITSDYTKEYYKILNVFYNNLSLDFRYTFN